MKNLKTKFGRIPSTFDPRDFNLRAFMPRSTAFISVSIVNYKNWEYLDTPLDQKDTPHCVGFSMANFGINLPIHTPYTVKDAHDFYYKCKVDDGSPNKEEGASIRNAARVLKQEGKIDAYAFAMDITAIKWWLLHRGPLMVGTIWTEGMLTSDENNMILPIGNIVGGHAYLLNEWTKDGKVGIQSSWGTRWGINGKAYMTADNFTALFKYGGEAVTAVELPVPSPSVKILPA